MKDSWIKRLLNRPKSQSWIRSVISGSMYRISDMRGNTSLADIKTQIDTMRALARDAQISTALSYYATDATTVNTDGQIIWAVPRDKNSADGAEIINKLFDRWNINRYARDHILELATIGNLYIPTTDMYKDRIQHNKSIGVALDSNTIIDTDYDIIPSTKIPPEDIVHLWYRGKPVGYMTEPSDNAKDFVLYPESAVVHFSLGGMLGDYTIDTVDSSGNVKQYDIQFAQPLMEKAVQPTQTLSLLEDALLLSSLTRVVRFINVECGNTAEEDEIQNSLQQIKDAIEQQLSLNTSTGDVQSFVNPQSPNNLIYIPKVNGQDAISITDLNMAEATSEDSKLLQYYQDKKLSVLGVPKEAMNFSSSEGLGGAGAVMSQRSALYSNALQRVENAYIEGWTDAINKYLVSRNLSGYIGTYKLVMNPIITLQSTVNFDRRDAAIGQAQNMITILKDLGVTEKESYTKAITEILSEVLPQTGTDAMTWNLGDMNEGGDDSGI